jgi:hypothetical protein
MAGVLQLGCNEAGGGSENKALCIFLRSQLFGRGVVVSSLPTSLPTVQAMNEMVERSCGLCPWGQ